MPKQNSLCRKAPALPTITPSQHTVVPFFLLLRRELVNPDTPCSFILIDQQILLTSTSKQIQNATLLTSTATPGLNPHHLLPGWLLAGPPAPSVPPVCPRQSGQSDMVMIFLCTKAASGFHSNVSLSERLSTTQTMHIQQLLLTGFTFLLQTLSTWHSM